MKAKRRTRDAAAAMTAVPAPLASMPVTVAAPLPAVVEGAAAARREEKCFNDGWSNPMATFAPSPDTQQTPRPNGLYERDFYSWGLQQADALRRRDFSAIDWGNLIEEIEDLAKAQQHNWVAYCARAIEHLLKIDCWDRSTEWVLRHWSQEVENFRDEMAKLIKKTPV